MIKRTIELLFKLPSMSSSYLVAGSKGISREIKRIDILETSYPEVVRFLEPNEFMFTSFWNSKDDKNSRIKLVESMIEHKCAGIGIMPGLNLNGIIDEEIIQIGNEHSFPVIYIDSSSRWSDIIKEFYDLQINKYIIEDSTTSGFAKLLFTLGEFNNHKNIKVLADELSNLLQLSTIIMDKDNFYISELENSNIIVEKVISKINAVKSVGNYSHSTGIFIYYNLSQYILSFYGTNSVFAIIVNKNQLDSYKENLYYSIAPFIVSQIDKLQDENSNKYSINIKRENEKYYFFLIRKESIHNIIKLIKGKCVIYKINKELNYVICIISCDNLNRENIYREYHNIISNTNPDFFIFSDIAFKLDSINNFTNIISNIIPNLYFLKGIFSFSEMSIIYMLTTTPFSYRNSIYNHYINLLNCEKDPIFLDTLRLFVVLKSINIVSELLNIHVNTVKYRILKAINSDMFYTTNITNDIWNLDLLIILEILKIENL
jgi:hypothetical protein